MCETSGEREVDVGGAMPSPGQKLHYFQPGSFSLLVFSCAAAAVYKSVNRMSG